MSTVTFKRALQTLTSTYTASVIAGIISETAGKIYLPLSFDSFDAPDISIDGCTLTSTQTKISGAAGAFDNVRVGDIVTSTSTGTLTAKSAVTINTCYVAKLLPYIIYPDTADISGIKAGDAVTGTGIGADCLVDKIDTVSRIIYLTVANTAAGANNITFTPPVRVTAVRPSTALSNANQIDIDTTIATSGAASTIVITPGAGEAIFAVLRVEPLSNSTGGRLNVALSVYYGDGADVKGSTTGYSELTFSTLSYSSLSTFGIDADTFLVDARLPRPTS
jgi:hypothetical protein